ncbi:hypothetical protein Tco_0440979, partial [Tanacetum coccineum]
SDDDSDHDSDDDSDHDSDDDSDDDSDHDSDDDSDHNSDHDSDHDCNTPKMGHSGIWVGECYFIDQQHEIRERPLYESFKIDTLD